MHPDAPFWDIRSDEPLATWDADFPADIDKARLLAWQRAVIRAGEDTDVYRVTREPRTGYHRSEHGSFADHLDRLGDQAPIDSNDHSTGLLFDDTLEATTLLAHPAAGGTIRETSLYSMREIADRAPSTQRPLSLAAGRNEPGGPPGVEIWIATKLWLPWAYRYPAGPSPDPDNPPIDNRTLAARNTPRLNTFLAAAATATRAVGGTWRLGRDTLADYRFELDDSGIRLDADRPAV